MMMKSDSVLLFLFIYFFVESDLAKTLHCVSPLITQPAFTCSKLTIETLEKGVKYVQS